MFRISIILASLVLLASCATGPQITPAALADLAPTGKLRAGINYGNPLFTARDPKTGSVPVIRRLRLLFVNSCRNQNVGKDTPIDTA